MLFKNTPCIIFDKNNITTYSILGKYSFDINLFLGYKFVEFRGIDFVNIYPKNYKEFKKQLGFHIFIRFIFFSIKRSGFEGIMISFFTLSTNYNEAINYLDKTFKSN